jgi:hypothetical protein
MFRPHAAILRRRHSATILVKMPTPENGRVRPKHVAEEYTQVKYKDKNVAFRTVIELVYRILLLFVFIYLPLVTIFWCMVK